MMSQKPFFALIICSLFFSCSIKAVENGPRILASIKPLQLIMASLIAEGDHLELLISPKESPHTYTMRPSAATKLKRADLVIWVGEGLETKLAKSLSRKNGNLELVSILSDQFPEFADDEHDEHGDDEHDERDEHDEHGGDEHGGDEHGDDEHHHGPFDPHVWLAPDLVAEAAKIISLRLSSINPERAKEYSKNLQNFLRKLEREDRRIKNEFKNYRSIPFMSVHDGYKQLVRYYELDYRGYVYEEESLVLSPKRLSAIRQDILNGEIKCILVEPQFKADTLNKITRGVKLNQQVLDFLGIDLRVGLDSYFVLLSRLMSDLKSCLAQT